jgi:AcrR family transcriptional regulator
MNVRARPTPEETADRILTAAEELFRRIGYTKTAIADIAHELGMSSANVYRYFPSKSAINEAICSRLLSEAHRRMDEIAARPLPASERLRDILLMLSDYNRACYTSERRMHDMVEAAMEENWGVIQAHLEYMVTTFARLIGEGVAAGEFRPQDDPVATAFTVKQACTCVLHPLMIAERIRHGMDQPGHAERLVNFAVNALKV